jgi:hypothetical protein
MMHELQVERDCGTSCDAQQPAEKARLHRAACDQPAVASELHEGGMYGEAGSRCPSRLYRGRRTAYFGLPNPNALQEKFYR